MCRSELGRKNQGRAVWLRFSESEDRSVGEVLKGCYQSLAAGTDYKANFSFVFPETALELVRYATEHEVYHPTRIDTKAAVWQYFLQQLSSVVTVLGRVPTEQTKKDAEWADELLQTATEHPDYLRMCNIYQIIRSEWEQLNSLSITFRLLYAMAVMATWQDDVEMRERLSQILQMEAV